jgi:CMP/dCMP kinase
MIIAIDGPSAAGKGTLARGVAQHLGYHFLDTGALYRRVGLSVLRGATDPVAAAQTLNVAAFDDAELRDETVAQAASKVAAIPEALEFSTRICAKKTGCGFRWARHWHGDLPQCRFQILCDSLSASPR